VEVNFIRNKLNANNNDGYKQAISQVFTCVGKQHAKVKMRPFWDIVPCSLEVDGLFRTTYCLHHQGDD
jgi:hypothetical protein